MISIGCDIISIERIEQKLSNPRFLKRVFTAREQTYIVAAPQSAAGLWAAKEACAKALGTGFSGFSITDIEILHTKEKKPLAILHGGALERMQALGGQTMHISISHDGGFALAFAVLE